MNILWFLGVLTVWRWNIRFEITIGSNHADYGNFWTNELLWRRECSSITNKLCVSSFEVAQKTRSVSWSCFMCESFLEWKVSWLAPAPSLKFFNFFFFLEKMARKCVTKNKRWIAWKKALVLLHSVWTLVFKCSCTWSYWTTIYFILSAVTAWSPLQCWIK